MSQGLLLLLQSLHLSRYKGGFPQLIQLELTVLGIPLRLGYGFLQRSRLLLHSTVPVIHLSILIQQRSRTCKMVYYPEPVVGVGEQQMLMLAVYVDYTARYGRKLRQRHRLVVEKRAGTSGRGDYPAEYVFLTGLVVELGLHHTVAGIVAEDR